MEPTNHSRNQELKVHRATICSPDVRPDPQLRDAVRSRFGFKPILVIGVSSRFYQCFGEADHEHPMRLVARGGEQRNVLVLMLQFGGHQLRCVASLRRPPVQKMLNAMRQRGSLPLVVFDADGHRYAGLVCDVLKEDVDAIAASGLPAVADAKDCSAELSYVALRCLLRDEMPSIVPGETLRQWDVALVEDAASLKTTPMT